MELSLSVEQEEGIALTADLTKQIACVTGQAGTGKTTILKYAYEALAAKFDFPEEANPELTDLPIALAAPTGRAAKRIEEATGIPAMTIHRMLRYTTPKDEKDITLPRHDRFNPMNYDVVLVDEASMIDEKLYRGIIDALKRGAIVRLFGDINQLPPIMSGSPFDAAMKKFPTAILSHNYRSDDGIISVSDKIIKGRIPIANNQVSFFRVKQQETMMHVRSLCDQTDFTQMNHQIITPTQRTKAGADTINTFIQQQYNPEKKKIQTFQKDHEGNVIVRSFKRGDKVLWTKNDYNLEIMNGTLGIVQSFDEEEGSILVTFDGTRDVLIPPSIETFNPTTGERYRYDPRTYLMLGYAITTHKAQGSQFDVVMYVLSRSRAATRQNLYTAVTRAKNKLIVINVAGALMHALNTKSGL